MMGAVTLPFGPPLDPMLARLSDSLPDGAEWVYEPKWDGFRAIVYRDGSEVHIGSRDHKPLQRYFPELPAALARCLPERCIVDGEVIVGGADGLDFDALLQRIHPARSRIEKLARDTPAAFVVFDVLALDGDDLRPVRFSERRTILEGVLPTPAEVRDSVAARTQVVLTPQTADSAEATRWMSELEGIGLDGIVAKRRDGVYEPGERVMLKVKLQRTADCVVGGYRLSKAGDGVGSLLLGLYDEGGNLAYVGHTSSFKAQERRALLAELRPLETDVSFAGGRVPGEPSRWASAKEKQWTAVEPKLVCEVAFDRLMGRRFRHSSRFVRWRHDRAPQSCTFDQLRHSGGS
jgi:ATP-dependent DNA ligase